MGLKTTSLSALGLTARQGRNVQITGITADSREVRAGFLFAALAGVRQHGAAHVAAALEAGASAILTDAEGAAIAAPALVGHDAALVVTADPRQALAYAAALWFGEQPETVVAVTGTNGKTSVASFVRQIWQVLGLRAVNLGTTGVEGDWPYPLAHTTPDPVTLHRALAGAAQAGVDHTAMEASSHGLDQRRLDGVRLAAAGFTNLSRDHLDYHPDMAAYFAAKLGLFTRVLPDDGAVVVNLSDPYGQQVAEQARARGLRVMGVGRDATADLQIMAQRFHPAGQELRLRCGGLEAQVPLDLIGDFQAENAAIAAGLVIATGAEPAAVLQAMCALTTVQGRMQLAAKRRNGACVYVDYAHTPDAIATALAALRQHVMGRLVAIIGAGGDRDAGKRALMGRAAAEAADRVIVTDDNPRSEPPADIRAQVMQGAPQAVEYADRAEAILRAVDALGPGDALLICGKGHETGQIVGDTVYPFDDVEQASIAVATLDGGKA